MALLQVHFSSDALELKTAMNVVLPERPCPHADGKWPTLYLLHGLSDDESVWGRRTSVERYADEKDIAVVMPAVQRSFYTDMRHGLRYWTFVSSELPEICERMFPLSIVREGRFAAGLSMGRYGAFKLGLRKPDRYAAVASLSGAVDVAGLADIPHDAEQERFFADIFGELDLLPGSDDDLCAVSDRLIASGQTPPKMYMACGVDDFLYENNQGFLRRFGKPFAITYEEGPGAHTWTFWDTYIQRALDWLPL